MSVTKVSAALMESGTKGADISSSSTIVIGTDGSYFDITGTTGIGTMTVDAGRIFTLQFDGAVVLTHSSTLYLAGAANFTSEANDHLTFVAVAANDVRQIGAGLKDGGSPVAAAGGFTLATEQSTTSGTAKTFSGIPAGTKMIVIMFNEVGFSGIDDLIVTIGDSGGLETAGYISTGNKDANAGSATAAFHMFSTDGNGIISGQMFLTLEDSSAFTWIESHTAKINSASILFGGGSKSLSAELTQLSITRDGSNTFDLGAVNIMYQ